MQAIQGNVAFADRNDKTDMPILFCPLSIAAIFAQDDEKSSDGGIAAVAAVAAQDADANGDWDGCWDWEDPYCHLAGTIIYTPRQGVAWLGNHHFW